MKVLIYIGSSKDKNTGFVYFDEGDHSVMVTHPHIEVRRRVYEYLNTPKEFRVPQSSEVGSMMLIIKKPNESVSLMEMALCEMYSTIGVHVDWNSSENVGGSTFEHTIAKSINKDKEYKIINK